jgi:hypothetical protein
MVNPYQFANLILEPAYKACNMYSLNAMYLMTCIAGVESKLTHLKQLPNGPAVGLFQVEPATYIDTCRYLNLHPALRDQILSYCQYESLPNVDALIHNLAFNALIARVKIWMIPEQIPSYKDPAAQAAYYEKYYNANADVDKTQEFIKFAAEVSGWINHEGVYSS